jgi:flagellar hook-length control protein FliK
LFVAFGKGVTTKRMTAISALSSLGLPGQLLDLLSGVVGHHGSKSANTTTNASHAASFSGVLNGTMTSGATDPLAQLEALIKSGTPISSIVDQLANQIADAVAKRLPASQLASGASRTALVSSIKSALSPPSNAPPGTAANQVAALEQRLQRWLEGLSGGADQQVGQQSDISGKILDANSARELPAQMQGSKSTSVATDAASLARSLLKSVAAALTGDASSTAPNAAMSAKTGTPAPAPAADPSASASTTAQNAATTPASTPGDLVARMIVRAAGVDAQHNANLPTVQSAAPSAQIARGTAGSTSTSSSATTAAKMTLLLTQAVNAAAEGAEQRGAAQDDALRDQDTSSVSSAVPSKSAARTDLSSFSLPTSPSPITAAQTQNQATAADGAPVDPTAAIEQLVKSMAMRTGSDGTSEMRLRLQPESLGTVTLKLTVDGNNVSANVVAQNGEARSALLAQQHHLARSLADSGLKLTSFTVDLSGGQAQDQTRDRTSGFGRRYTVHEMAAADADATESSSTGPALLPSSTLGLLSYLA